MVQTPVIALWKREKKFPKSSEIPGPLGEDGKDDVDRDVVGRGVSLNIGGISIQYIVVCQDHEEEDQDNKNGSTVLERR